MLTKIALTVAAAVVLLGTASATFAAPKDRWGPEVSYSPEPRATPKPKAQNYQRIPEPLYFKFATGDLN
jgi:hypothetical protein